MFLQAAITPSYSDSLHGFRPVIDGIKSNGCFFTAAKEIANSATQTRTIRREKVPEGLRTSTMGLKRTATTRKSAAQGYSFAQTACWNTTMAPMQTTKANMS